MKEYGQGNANGKIILMGEHSVVYGEPAIALPFKATQITATITDSANDLLVSDYYQGALQTAPKALKSVKELVQKLQTDLQTAPISLKLTSTIPAERGMGSSAAVAVAITRAFFDWQEKPLDQRTLLSYVDHSEKIAHGNPSGIDAAATSGQQPIFFEKGAPFEPFKLNLDAYLVVADTGVKGKTRETVKSVAHLFEHHRKQTAFQIQQLGEFAKEAKLAIMHNQPEQLGKAMNRAQNVLEELAVSDETLDRLISAARKEGALGAKLTGGGRGGCMIALAANAQDAQRIANELNQQGAAASWIQELGVYQHA